ncbi:MAG: response regulator [Myxococcaceae bacterium]|nr:response regulator [Myxococcaceae bacterium]
MSKTSAELDVLFVEDSEDDAELIARELRRGGFAPKWERVDSVEGLRDALKRRRWQIVVSDNAGPQLDAMNALAAIDELAPGLPLLVVSGKITPDFAVKAMKAGAADCIPKDDLSRLPAVVTREVGRAQAPSLAESIEAAQESERRKIARSLHDQFGQILTALRLTLAAARRSTGAEQNEKLTQAEALVEQATQQIRDFSVELWPTILDDLGLPSALRWLADRQTQWSGIDVRVEAEAVGRLPVELEAACFRIAQEALTNVARHARASKVVVSLGVQSGGVELSVVDDGKGFDTSEAWSRVASGESLGLRSMRDRLSAVGGELHLTSQPGAGTTLNAKLPLPRGSAKKR